MQAASVLPPPRRTGCTVMRSFWPAAAGSQDSSGPHAMADPPGVTYTAGVSERKKVILDIAFRRLEEVFHPDDLNHLHEIVDVVWGRNEPIPEAEFEAAKADAFAIVTGRWRHGDVAEMPELQAILEMGGRHPSPDVLDYRACFARNIRVLSVAPAFGPMVCRDGHGHGPGRGARRGVRVGGVSERHGAVSAPRQRAQLHPVRQDRGPGRLRQPGAQPDAAAGPVPLQSCWATTRGCRTATWPAWACSRWRWRRCSNRPG